MKSQMIRAKEDFRTATGETALPGRAALMSQPQEMQRPVSLIMGNVLPFKANRKAIKSGNRDFLLDTSRVENGTGIARFLEILPDGRAILIGCSYCNDPVQGWIFGQYRRAIPMPTPEKAAQEFIKKAMPNGCLLTPGL